MRKTTTLAALFLPLFLAACGQKLSGTYASVSPQGLGNALDGAVILEFESGDKVVMKSPFGSTETNYSVDGNKLKIAANGQNMILEIQDDGSIAGWPGGMLLKKK